MNYRPISIPNFSKVFEMSVYNGIYDLVKNGISITQRGFTNQRSTMTSVLVQIRCNSNVSDCEGQFNVLHTDFSKAFDHKVIIQYSCRSLVLQMVTIWGIQWIQSNSYIVSSEVLQGSNLGPLLCLLIVNDISDYIDCDLYPDDLKMYNFIHEPNDYYLPLQSQLISLMDWCDITEHFYM